jgi:hypothetical protein
LTIFCGVARLLICELFRNVANVRELDPVGKVSPENVSPLDAPKQVAPDGWLYRFGPKVTVPVIVPPPLEFPGKEKTVPACEMPRAERKITMKKTDRKMLKGGKKESMFMFSLVGSGDSKACWLGDAL